MSLAFLQCSVSDSEEIYDSFVTVPAHATERNLRTMGGVRISPSQPTLVDLMTVFYIYKVSQLSQPMSTVNVSAKNSKKVTSPAWLHIGPPPPSLPYLGRCV
jgi:hypothetical protein